MYRFYEEIDTHTAAYIKTVANVENLEEIPLSEINSFLAMIGERETETELAH